MAGMGATPFFLLSLLIAAVILPAHVSAWALPNIFLNLTWWDLTPPTVAQPTVTFPTSDSVVVRWPSNMSSSTVSVSMNCSGSPISTTTAAASMFDTGVRFNVTTAARCVAKVVGNAATSSVTFATPAENMLVPRVGAWVDPTTWGLGRVPCPSDFVEIGNATAVQTNFSVVVNESVVVRSIALLSPGSALRLVPGSSLRLVTSAQASQANAMLLANNFAACDVLSQQSNSGSNNGNNGNSGNNGNNNGNNGNNNGNNGNNNGSNGSGGGSNSTGGGGTQQQAPGSTGASSGGGGGMAIIAAAAGGGAALLILILVIVLLRRRKANGTKTVAVLKSASSDPFEIPRSNLSMGSALPDGYYGRVRQATLSGHGVNRDVVVMTLAADAPPQQRNAFKAELDLHKGLHEPAETFIVRFVGYCTVRDPLLLVMADMEVKLVDHLREGRQGGSHGQGLSSFDLSGFARQTVQGVQYLHSRGVVHRNLSASHVYVGVDGVCRVGDFARDSLLAGAAAVRWLAPECLQSRSFNVRADLWSLGVVLWEIMTYGATPYFSVPIAKLPDELMKGSRLPRPGVCPLDMYAVISRCWSLDPGRRPDTNDLIEAVTAPLPATQGPPSYLPFEKTHVQPTVKIGWDTDWNETVYTTGAASSDDWDQAVYNTQGDASSMAMYSTGKGSVVPTMRSTNSGIAESSFAGTAGNVDAQYMYAGNPHGYNTIGSDTYGSPYAQPNVGGDIYASGYVQPTPVGTLASSYVQPNAGDMYGTGGYAIPVVGAGAGAGGLHSSYVVPGSPGHEYAYASNPSFG